MLFYCILDCYFSNSLLQLSRIQSSRSPESRHPKGCGYTDKACLRRLEKRKPTFKSYLARGGLGWGPHVTGKSKSSTAHPIIVSPLQTPVPSPVSWGRAVSFSNFPDTVSITAQGFSALFLKLKLRKRDHPVPSGHPSKGGESACILRQTKVRDNTKINFAGRMKQPYRAKGRAGP